MCVLIATGLTAHFRANPIGYQDYLVNFSLANGVQGIQMGSPVDFGGLNVGQVTGLQYQEGNLQVKISLEPSMRLYRGAQIQRVGSLIGGPALLVIASQGSSQGGLIEPGTVLIASASDGGLANVIGKKNALHLEQIQTSLENAFDGLQEIGLRAERIGENAQALSEIAQTLRTDVDTWEPKFDAIETNFASIQSKGASIDERFQALHETDGDPETSMRPGNVLMRAYRDVVAMFEGERLEAIRTNWDTILTAAQEIETEFTNDVRPKAEKVIETAEASWGNLTNTRDSLQRLATEARSSLDVFMANSTLAAQQLTLTESEVIGSLGLDLLARPSKEDIQIIAMQAALGDWTRSAFTLRESLESIEGITIQSNQDSEATLARLVDTLNAALADYEDAQREFFRTLTPPTSDK